MLPLKLHFLHVLANLLFLIESLYHELIQFLDVLKGFRFGLLTEAHKFISGALRSK